MGDSKGEVQHSSVLQLRCSSFGVMQTTRDVEEATERLCAQKSLADLVCMLHGHRWALNIRQVLHGYETLSAANAFMEHNDDATTLDGVLGLLSVAKSGILESEVTHVLGPRASMVVLHLKTAEWVTQHHGTLHPTLRNDRKL